MTILPVHGYYLVRALGPEHFKKLARATSSYSDDQKNDALKLIRNRDLQLALKNLFRYQDDEARLVELSKMLLEFLMGFRLYKRHSDELGLQQRLDTTESKTQALHDVVFISNHFGVLNGLFLFLDELEKVGAFPTQVTTRYLSAIRALIDALPNFLFLGLAMSTDALDRYSKMLPALGGRLENVFELQPLKSNVEAIDLYNFYLEKARESALQNPITEDWTAGDSFILKEDEVSETFKNLAEESRQKGLKGGATPRTFLDRVHDRTRRVFSKLS